MRNSVTCLQSLRLASLLQAPADMTRTTCLLSLLALALAQTPSLAQEPLHVRLDQAIEADQIGPAANLAGDEEFVRRIYVDLVGMVPTAAEVKAFLDDATPDKRTVLIDRLLADPRHPLQMAQAFDVMLMERRPDKSVPAAEWQAWLAASFRENKPWDQMAREILSADGNDPATRPAAKFFLDREAEPNLMTREVGRIFFGRDLQCAQCHDHPLVDDYLQTDYYGLFAFVSRTSLFNDEAQKKMLLAERAEGEADYKSVFTGDAGRMRPRLPGDAEVVEPRFRLGEEYTVAPADKVRSVPKYSRRAKLAELATNGQNRAFNENIVNRVWAQLLGRGLVHPVDMLHAGNPAAHPAALDLLATEFPQMKYNLRALVREIVLTRAYQRSLDLPTEVLAKAAEIAPKTAAVEQTLAEITATSEAAQSAFDTAMDEFKTTRKSLEPAEAAYAQAQAAVAAAKKPVDDAQAALAKSQADLGGKQSVLATLTDAAAKSDAAAKALPNDKEVAAALATFQARVTSVTTEIAAVTKTIEDQTAAVQVVAAKLAEAQVVGDAAWATLEAARQPLEAAKAKLHVARLAHQQQQVVLTAAKRRQQALVAYQQHVQAVAAVPVAMQQIQAGQAAVVVATQSVEQQQAEVVKATTAVTEMAQQASAVQTALQAAQAELAGKQQLVQTIAAAVTQTGAALEKLPGDADLVVASEKLTARLKPLAEDLTSFEPVVAAKDAELKQIQSQQTALQQQMAVVMAELASRQQKVAEQQTVLQQSEAQLAAAQASVQATLEPLFDTWTVEGSLRGLKPLMPEQMGWSFLQATGVLEQHLAAADAEIEKTLPKAQAEQDPAQKALRTQQVINLLHERMKGNIPVFVQFYGAAPGQPQDDFFATADQALFLANGGVLNSWLNPGGGNLTDRLLKLEDPAAVAEELYFSVLARRPSDAEKAAVAQMLTARPMEKPVVAKELAWGLLTSAEFRFNH